MGGSSGSSYDASYNSRIAALMESADERTQALYENYMTGGGLDYENAQYAAGLELLPAQTELAGLQLSSATELLPYQTELSKAQLGLDLQSTGYKSDIMSKFYEALGQNNPELEASQAGTDVAESYKNVRASDELAQKRRGLYRPTTNTGLSYSEARDTAGAMSEARAAAKKANLEEYATGLSL